MHQKKRDMLEAVIDDLAIIQEEYYYGHKGINLAVKALDGALPRSKGDYMEAVKEMDEAIKEMDSAIPQHLSTELEKLGVDRSGFVYAYYKNGTEGLLDVMSRYAYLINNL